MTLQKVLKYYIKHTSAYFWHNTCNFDTYNNIMIKGSKDKNKPPKPLFASVPMALKSIAFYTTIQLFIMQLFIVTSHAFPVFKYKLD